MAVQAVQIISALLSLKKGQEDQFIDFIRGSEKDGVISKRLADSYASSVERLKEKRKQGDKDERN